MPRMALNSFWAKRVTPLRPAYLKLFGAHACFAALGGIRDENTLDGKHAGATLSVHSAVGGGAADNYLR